MPAKLQTRWAIVGCRGFIHTDFMCFTRRGAIDKVMAEYRQYRPMQQYAGLTDAQFWRVLKRLRGWQVRRVSLRVAR